MWRTVLGQTTYQCLVMFVFQYWGPAIFGKKYALINCPYYVDSNLDDFNSQPTNKVYHHTFLFATFMFMNIFNMLNARKLGVKDFNIF